MNEKKNEKGFTLLELLVSLAIVMIIILAFYRVIDSTQRINTKNDRDIKALNILQSEIESLRSQIKQPLDKDGNRKLVVKDEKSNTDIPIIFKNDVAKVDTYYKVDTNTNSIYIINNLTIKRELITGNKKSSNQIFNDYKYTIDISVILENEYFSKKSTDIKDVVILSNGIESDGEDGHIPPDFNNASFVRYQVNQFVFGSNNESDDVSTLQVNEQLEKIKIKFTEKLYNDSKKYVDIRVKYNNNENYIGPTWDDYFQYYNAEYYSCKGVRFVLNTWNGNDVECKLKNLKINGTLVSDQLILSEKEVYDFNVNETGEVIVEFEVDVTTKEHFTIIFGR